GPGPAGRGVLRGRPRRVAGRVRRLAGPPQRHPARAGHPGGDPGLAARGQGAGVGRGLPARTDRGNAADRLRADRRGDRGGAQAAVRGRDAGPGADLPVLVAGPVTGGPPDPQAVPVPRRLAAAVGASSPWPGSPDRYRARVSTPLDNLIDLLDLEEIEANIFRGRSPSDWRQRVFGGQVAGQALVAAGRAGPAAPPGDPAHAAL